MAHTKPRQVFLIHYQQGFPEKGDYTRPARIEDRQRLFYEAKVAGNFLDALEAWPAFHKVIAVYRIGVPSWEQIDPNILPRAVTEEES